jgi:hypothetical protein
MQWWPAADESNHPVIGRDGKPKSTAIRQKQADADDQEILTAHHFRNHLTGHQTLPQGHMQPSLRILKHK